MRSIKKTGIYSTKGFTLVELLIVVAIIGVLASQGVPAYRRMIQKSRKGEAQVMLGGIAIAETGFFGEYGQYTNNLARAGAQTDGQGFNYAGGFSNNTCTAVAVANIVPVAGTAVGQVPNLPGNWATGIAGPVNNLVKTTSMIGNTPGYVPAGNNGRTNCTVNATVAPAPAFPAVGVVVGAISTYVASATGNLRNPNDPTCAVDGLGANPCDAWYIDQNRRMVNVIDGISN